MSAPVHLVRWLPIKRRFSAITLPPFGIFIRRQWWCQVTYQSRARLLRHERVHWEQAERLGIVGYYVMYLVFAVIFGYDDHPMELEARR